jgi:hypothetical protein
VDWRFAGQACAAWFDNKYLLAVPMLNQTGAPVNNGLFVYNFITQGWDGFWQGAALRPVQFLRQKVGGQERLAWINADGSVHYFTEGDLDLTSNGPGDNTEAMIVTQLLTRAYTAGSPRTKQWHQAELVVDTLAATWSATAITEGYNQSRPYQGDVTKDPTRFFQHGQAQFQNWQSDRANLPFREDYGVLPDSGYAPVSPETPTYQTVTPTIGFATFSGLTVGATYRWTHGNEVQLDLSGLDPGTSGSFTAAFAFVYALGTPGQPVTGILEELVDGVDLPAEGLPLDAHQTYLKRVPVREQSRSLQLRLDNTTGSARWRSVFVSAAPERGD